MKTHTTIEHHTTSTSSRLVQIQGDGSIKELTEWTPVLTATCRSQYPTKLYVRYLAKLNPRLIQ